jgi:hypothetical protein
MKRIAYTIGLVVAVGAMVVPASTAGNVVLTDASGPNQQVVQHDPWFLHLQARQAAANAPAASFYTDAALDAWGQRLQAQANQFLTTGSNVSPDDRVGVRGTGPVTTATPVSDTGIDWGKFGIGLGAGALALMLAAGLFAVMRSRHPVHA